MSTITREPVTHNLKIWPEYFAAVRDGLKRAELRWNDREYQAGDIIDLCEWDPNEEAFTGDFISVTVTHVADLGQWMPGYVLLSVDPPAPVSVTDIKWPEEKFCPAEYAGSQLWEETEIWNKAIDACKAACRAAMLQGADGNALVSPDGWVACIERMPDIDTEIFYFCKDDGLRDCGIVSTSNFSGRGDAQLYVHAEGYDLRLGVDITHWMPLPAAPQQGDSF
ncbi:DUF3850 domain-containing protein [Enterobacter hormaechei]|uniref:DUF3850 domain-containing protein n=1 Tax=Enterobacter hormaechei TaxID=158836 RepID=UPI003038FCDE|nr:DUF3850 domain-containing protein [Enterobacter hormaechei subsp. xiangfangensis]